jgi:polysaccharide chain length determinant protein (PEP-CTERM system associated)
MLLQKYDLNDYISILLRRKWYIVIPFLLFVLAGVIYALATPKLYQSTTLILVQRQKVPDTYIKSTVTDALSDRINTLKQQVTSRTNLEHLITTFDLYTSSNPSKTEMIMQDKLKLMRQRIFIRVMRSAAFSISFIDEDPYKTRDITNALASNFINEHLRAREDQSIGTTVFLEKELARIKQLLSGKESALTAYKQQHMGAMPDQLATNLALRGQLRKQIESIERSLGEARSQKIMLQGQITTMKQMTGSESVDSLIELDTQDVITSAPQVQKLKERLENLLLRYTEKHPDVIKLKRMIARTEEKQQLDTQTSEEKLLAEGDLTLEGGGMLKAQVETLQMQLASIVRTIEDHHKEKGKLEKKTTRLDKIIADTPKRQLDLISLQRDYDIIKRQYDSLLAKKLESQLASNMEKKQKGEQFKVIDPAKLPEKPFKPNRPRILLLTVLAGLGVGCGLALGMEYLDQSFWNYDEVGEFLQLPVLAVIPWIKTTDDARKQKRFRVFAYCLSGCLLVVVCIGVWLLMNYSVVELVEKIKKLV